MLGIYGNKFQIWGPPGVLCTHWIYLLGLHYKLNVALYREPVLYHFAMELAQNWKQPPDVEWSQFSEPAEKAEEFQPQSELSFKFVRVIVQECHMEQ